MFKFCWETDEVAGLKWKFTEEDFDNCKRFAQDLDNADYYVGAVRVGDLCFDFVLRQLENHTPLWLCYDLYVGGIDDGYGYGLNNYPYSFDDGDCFATSIYDLSYEEFKSMAEKVLTDYINKNDNSETYNLVQKANEPLHIW